jgi:hypothetical protein
MKYVAINGIDMTTNHPCIMQYASCLVARYDNGFSNHQKARTGVLIRKISNFKNFNEASVYVEKRN